MVKRHPDNFSINLQLFAEKTERATPKKRQKAAEKGQLARSQEINSAVVLLVAFLAVKFIAPTLVDGWAVLTSDLFNLFSQRSLELNYPTLQNILLTAILYSSRILVPIVGGVMAAGLAGSVMQIGFRFSMSAIQFDLKNIDPLQGLKGMFSLQSLAELIKSLLKVLMVSYIVYAAFAKEFMNFPGLSDMSIKASSAFIGQFTMDIVQKVIILLIILAVIDFAFQKWRHERKLMMDKQEIKDEYKQTEGDPQLKAKIKQKQREVSMRRMMQMLPKADVVITNPTHFAVALRYDAKIMKAPEVIAKGQDRVALRIKELAQEFKIVIVENKPLAQSLYYSVEIGEAIPSDLFQAVAEALAFVYKLKGKV